MAARDLPRRPNLEHLRNEARDLHRELEATGPDTKLSEGQHRSSTGARSAVGGYLAPRRRAPAVRDEPAPSTSAGRCQHLGS